MSAKAALKDLPDWPAQMDVETAALYCGMSADSFELCVQAGKYPKPIDDLPIRRKLWQRAALDAAINRGVGADDWRSREAAHRRRREGRQAATG